MNVKIKIQIDDSVPIALDTIISENELKYLNFTPRYLGEMYAREQLDRIQPIFAELIENKIKEALTNE